jgi:hypothetical protein
VDNIEKRELFQKTFDALVCKALGKRRTTTREEQNELVTEQEKFAVKMGLQEIEHIRAVIRESIGELREQVMAYNLISELKEIDKGFEHMAKILKWSPSFEKSNGYRNLRHTRKQWIADLLNRYDNVGLGDDDEE